MFIGRRVVEYANSKPIKMITSTPYYAQANGQVKAVNKTTIALFKKHMGRQPRNCNNTPCQVLLAYRNMPKESIGITPYKLVYGHGVVLPVEINLQSIRVAKKNELPIEDCWHGMLD